MKILKNKVFQYTIIGFLFALIPFIFEIKRSTLTNLSTVVVYAIVAIGFNILLGYAGQISLGHAAFMGIGAYVSANIANSIELAFGLHYLLAILIAGLVPMIIGLLLGLVALRLSGHYLAIATLGFGVTIQHIFKEWRSFTNGTSPMRISPVEIFGANFLKHKEYFYVLAIIILVLLALFAYYLLKSKTGRALVAMRDSESAAQAMGISLLKYKLVAFAISSFYAGVAGALFMYLVRTTVPDQWGVMVSLNLLAMVVIGGLASIEGSIFGAAFIVFAPEIIKQIPKVQDISSNASYIFTGVAMILVIRFFPYGIARMGTQIKLLLLNKKQAVKKQEV